LKDKAERKEHVVSVRISSKLRNYLIQDSKKKNLQLGDNIEKILSEQQNWSGFSREILLIEVFRELFIELMVSLSDRKIQDIGKNLLSELLHSAIVFENGKLTIEGLFGIYERWIESNFMNSKKIEIENGHRFIIRHQLGKSFSKMTFEAWKQLTNKLDYKIIPIEMSNPLLVMDIIEIR
jgi:hypothetical protein